MAPPPPPQKEPTRGTSKNASKSKEHTATTAQSPKELPLSHEAPASSTDHSIITLTQSHTDLDSGQQNRNAPGASFDQTGLLGRAPVQEEVDSVPPLALPEVRSKPTKQLKQVKVVHNPSNQARIDPLCDQEQKTVTVDGGNTVSSQLGVLNAIEHLPSGDHVNRIWSETSQKGPDGKRRIKYHCNQPKCNHSDSTAQKARQHFVASHVEGAGWVCPIEGCGHDRMHKRLDDLKNHHMVPDHDIKYYRGRESLVHVGNPEAGRSHPYPTRGSNRRHQDSDRPVGPHRTNAGGSTGRTHDARSNTGELNRRARPRRNAKASMADTEQYEPQITVNEIPPPPRNRSLAPVEPTFQSAAHAGAFSPSIEGTSRSNPIIAEDFHGPSSSEPPYLFSQPLSRRPQFDDHARLQNRRHQDSDRPVDPHRTNAGGSTGRTHDARSNTGTLNRRTDARRNARTSMAHAEQRGSRITVNEIPSPPRDCSPAPVEPNFQHADAFSPSIAPIEGTSQSNPIIAGDFYRPSSSEPPYPFSPPLNRRPQFDEYARRQPSSLSQGEYYSPTRTSHLSEMDGSSPATYVPMSPLHQWPGSHVPSQIDPFSIFHPHDEELARVQRRDGLPGHDPPAQGIYTGHEHRLDGEQGATNNQTMHMDERLSSSPVIQAPGYDQYSRQQQLLGYGGSGSSHVSPSQVSTTPMSPHNYATPGNALQFQAHSWSSYALDGRNIHHYDRPSTSHRPPRRVPGPNSSFPSHQLPSPSHGAFTFPPSHAASSPNIGDEWPPYDEANFNPNDDNFGGN